MSGILLPNGKQQYLDANGNPLAGGKVYYYIPSTTTFKNTYQDVALTVLNTNPIILDSAGECIAYGSGSYRQQLYDVNNNLIWDQLTYGNPNNANSIEYDAPYANSVASTVQKKLAESVSVLDFGADPTNTSDSTTAIQNALNTGKSIFIPEGTYKISSQLNMYSVGQSIYGDGDNSVISAGSGTYSVIVANNLNYVTVSNIKIIATGGSSTISNGAGVQFVGVYYGNVNKVHVTNHAQAGVLLQNSYGCDIGDNLFTSAAGSSTTSLAADILSNYAGGQHDIHDNRCFGAGGYGIIVQTILDSPVDYQKNIRIVNNEVDTHNSYGIMLYAHTALSVIGCIVSNNTVKDITGARPDPSNGYTYGAGIYLQGDMETVVTGNYITNCNTSTGFDQLAPGAIGGTNGGNRIINNNIIDGTSWYGITVRDPNGQGPNGGNHIIDSNLLRNCGTNNGQAAIHVFEIGNVTVSNNKIYNQTSGLAINQYSSSTPRYFINIIDNIVQYSQYGVQTAITAYSTINRNTFSNITSNVIQTINSNYSTIKDNIITGTTSGVNIEVSATSNCYDNVIDGNTIISNQPGSGTNYGIWISGTYVNNTNVSNNDLSSCINMNQQTQKVLDNGTNTNVSNNKLGSGTLKGSFTLSTSSSTTISNTSAGYWTNIMLMPTNAAAATLMQGTKSLYVSAKTNDTSFTVTTADGTAPAGTETFNYIFY